MIFAAPRLPAALAILALLGAFTATTVIDIGVAEAQSRAQGAKRPGLFERLFGPRQTRPQNTIRQRLFKPKATVNRARPKREAPAPAPVEVAAKDPNARKILFVGDYVAASVADGLEEALAREPKLTVVDRSNASSGLVRADFYDWNKELLGILNEENPDVVIVSIGANDRQQLRAGNQRNPVRSPAWEATYTQRIDGLAETLKVYGRPFFWVGVPPMRTRGAAGDFTYINGLAEGRIEAAGGHYVDVWNGFTNASGEFISNGPDIEGQVRALRANDGVNFTRAGKAKLSYYVERELRRHTGLGAGQINLLASTSQATQIEIGPDGKKRLVGPVISLSDPIPGGRDALAGAPPPPIFYDWDTGQVYNMPEREAEPAEDSPVYKLVVKGEPLVSAAGRIDDFAWPPNRRAAQNFAAPGAAAADAAAAPAEGVDGEGEAILTPVSKSN